MEGLLCLLFCFLEQVLRNGRRGIGYKYMPIANRELALLQSLAMQLEGFSLLALSHAHRCQSTDRKPSLTEKWLVCTGHYSGMCFQSKSRNMMDRDTNRFDVWPS